MAWSLVTSGERSSGARTVIWYACSMTVPCAASRSVTSEKVRQCARRTLAIAVLHLRRGGRDEAEEAIRLLGARRSPVKWRSKVPPAKIRRPRDGRAVRLEAARHPDAERREDEDDVARIAHGRAEPDRAQAPRDPMPAAMLLPTASISMQVMTLPIAMLCTDRPGVREPAKCGHVDEGDRLAEPEGEQERHDRPAEVRGAPLGDPSEPVYHGEPFFPGAIAGRGARAHLRSARVRVTAPRRRRRGQGGGAPA